MRMPARSSGNAGLFVVGGHPTRTDAELDPAVGEEVERRHLARTHDRVLVVVAEHERADPQRLGHRGRVRERNGGCEVVLDEVVGDEQRRVAERLDLARELGELLARAALAAGHTETKSAIVHPATLTSPRRGLRGAPAAVQRRPVEPQPPMPRAESSSPSTSRQATSSTRWITSWAIRSPRCTSKCGSRVEIDQQHTDLVAVAGVDETGRVQAGHAVRNARPERGCTKPA